MNAEIASEMMRSRIQTANPVLTRGGPGCGSDAADRLPRIDELVWGLGSGMLLYSIQRASLLPKVVFCVRNLAPEAVASLASGYNIGHRMTERAEVSCRVLG